MPTLESLMSGGWEPDYDTDPADQFDLWVEEMRESASKMTDAQLRDAHLDAFTESDWALADIYKDELKSRKVGFTFEVSGYSTQQDEPDWYQDDPAHDDRRYAPVETDELPF